MDTKHITAVHYVHANDPIGRMLIQAAGDAWKDAPFSTDRRFLSGQANLIEETVHVLVPGEVAHPWDVRSRVKVLIRAAADGVLDAALDAIYSPHHDWCHVCEAVTEWDDDEKCSGCGRRWGYDS